MGVHLGAEQRGRIGLSIQGAQHAEVGEVRLHRGIVEIDTGDAGRLREVARKTVNEREILAQPRRRGEAVGKRTQTCLGFLVATGEREHEGEIVRQRDIAGMGPERGFQKLRRLLLPPLEAVGDGEGVEQTPVLAVVPARFLEVTGRERPVPQHEQRTSVAEACLEIGARRKDAAEHVRGLRCPAGSQQRGPGEPHGFNVLRLLLEQAPQQGQGGPRIAALESAPRHAQQPLRFRSQLCRCGGGRRRRRRFTGAGERGAGAEEQKRSEQERAQG